MTALRATELGIHVGDVVLSDRARKDLGDLRDLAASIKDRGLLHPIVVTRDNVLIAGHRRLEACKQLDWEAIPVTVAESITDAADLLRAERDENVCRKDMTPSELVAIGRRIEELERPKAEERKAEGQQRGGESFAGRLERTDTTKPHKTRTDEVVGKALGIGETTYRRAKRLVEAAEAGDEKAVAAVEQMDRNGKVTPAYNRYKDRPSAPSGRRALPSPEATGSMPDRSVEAVLERRNRIQELATSGRTSSQIGADLGIAEGTVKNLAREMGVTITADKVLGRARRIDSNRVARETVFALEGAAAGLNLIKYDDLDLAEVADWATSLTESMQAINRFVRRIKEMAQ